MSFLSLPTRKIKPEHQMNSNWYRESSKPVVQVNSTEALAVLAVVNYPSANDRVYLDRDESFAPLLRSLQSRRAQFFYVDAVIADMYVSGVHAPHEDGNDSDMWMLWFCDEDDHRQVAVDYDSPKSKERRSYDDDTGKKERAFHDEWQSLQGSIQFNNHGILHSLLNDVTGELPTMRDQKIAACLMQWLGTPCGGAFIHQAIQRSGLPRGNFF